MKTYFIADPHFYGEDILRYENRPFKSIHEMNDTIIKNWNATVNAGDTVFIVGDLADFNNCVKEDIETILNMLNGTKILIKGNHDTDEMIEVCKKLNIKVYDYPIVYNNYWIVSHEPMYVSEQMPYANIFGHIHNNPIYKTTSKRSYCVCVERNNFTPVLFDDIAKNVKDECQK